MLKSKVMYRKRSRVLIAIVLPFIVGLILQVSDQRTQPVRDQERDPSFLLEVDVDLVVLNVTVVDECGANLTSLTREDFSIYEDGVRQEISTFFPVAAPFKLVLVVDTSISTRNNLNLIKNAARNFTKELRPDDQIALAETHFFARKVQGFTNDRKLLRKAIKRLATYPYGGSKLYDGVAMALRSLQPTVSGRKAIVVLSDGMENSSHIKFEELRRLLAKDDAVFYPITILNKDRQKKILERYIFRNQNKLNDPYVENARLSLSVLKEVYQIQTERLNKLSRETGGKMFLVDDLSDLAGEYSKVAHELRNTFSLSYYSNKQGRKLGMRRIQVRVKNPDFRVRTRTSYFVGSAKSSES